MDLTIQDIQNLLALISQSSIKGSDAPTIAALVSKLQSRLTSLQAEPKKSDTIE